MFRRSDELVSNYQIKGTALDCSNNGEALAVAGGFMVNLTPSSLDFFHDTQCFNRISQNGKVSDFDFNVLNDNLVVSSTTNSVSIFDLRESRRPKITMSTIFGAQQAKFSKFDEFQVISAHGCDLRFWDIRNCSAPRRQIMAHENRIVSLVMNPTKPNVMITSALEDTFKVWNRYDEIDTSQVVLLSHNRVGKVIYSPSGDEFISMSIPDTVGDPNTVKMWRAPTFENPQELRKGLKDTYADACWHKGATGPFKYLFTLGRNSRLLRNPIIGNGLNNEPNEMPVPIVQSAEDRKRDKQLLGTSEMRQKAHSTDDDSMSHRTPSWTLFTDEWSGWVRAPNQDGGDLLSELAALRKVVALGLTTSEVNFQRAAIGFNYSHRGRCKRITIEMRFHKQFLENGWIYMEVVQKDSPLDAQSARQLLLLIQEESRNQTQAGGQSTVMARVLQNLPVLVEKLGVFTDSMDIPSSKTTINSTDSSMTEDTASHTVEPADLNRMFPISYGLTAYDVLVPSPRLCGGRFNLNGILCTFGKLLVIPVEGVTPEITFPKSTEKPKLEAKKVTMKRLSEGRNLSDKSRPSRNQATPKIPSLLRPNPEGKMVYPKTLLEYYQCVTPEHVGYLYQIAERAASARRVGGIAESSDRLSFSTASPLNAYSHNLVETARSGKSGSNRVIGSSPVSSLGMLAQRNASIHSNQATFSTPRRRVSSMSAGVVNEDSNPLLEPQFSTNVLVIDGSFYEGLSKELAAKYKLIGGSASEICYANLWAVVKEFPDRPDLISLWQILYEFMCASEEKEIQAYLRNEIETDFIGAEIIPFDSSRLNFVENELYNRHRLQLCALEFMTPDPYASRIGAHPCGKDFLAWFVEFYYQRYDVQTAAMITCILNESNRRNGRLMQLERPERPKSKRGNFNERSSGRRSSPDGRERVFRRLEKIKYLAAKFCPLFVTADDPDPMDLETMRDYFIRDHKHRTIAKSHIESEPKKEPIYDYKENRSADELRSSYDPTTESNVEDNKEKKSEILRMPTVMRLEGMEEDENEIAASEAWLEEKFDKIRQEYSVFLCRWGLLNQRTELNKFALKPEEPLLIKQVMKCSKCDRICDDSPICPDCELPALWCIICDEPCEGHVAICSVCGHGGHPTHLNEWFKSFDQCAALCGCRCSL
uniref:WD_REPEATS_REGION domain-containing protein n=1 Tax=Bursaphelenchus xylophilus TaxID=6326 RepID=A0A1I7SCD5_BURXY